MSEIEKTCDNCKYQMEDIEGTHCRHCIHIAKEHFKPMEYCEWEKSKSGRKQFYTLRTFCNLNFRAEIHMDNDFDFVYCPYCGKEIKVVE